MSHALTDQELIRNYRPDHPNLCFETLYKRYVNKVYGQCLTITRDAEKA